MKKIIIIALSIALCSCESYLDKAPDMGLSEGNVFANFYTTRGYLDKAYDCVVDYQNWNSQKLDRHSICEMSDEVTDSYLYSPMYNLLNKGLWLGTEASEVGWGSANVGTNTGYVIPNAFYGLRIANRIIEKVPTMTNLSDEEKNELLGQAYFFRSWFYFEVIRRVGGMPLIDHVFTSDEDMDKPRLTYQQSSDWIIEQLNKAIEILPDRWDAANTGRPTKAAAYALKSMAELYSASPLMCNPIDHIEDNGYDVERCKLAAQYAKECLDYIDTTVPECAMMPKSEYQHIFYHSPNFVSPESLWYLNSTGLNRNASADLPVLYQNIAFSGRSGNYGWACTCPSQNAVDFFETSNGYPVKLTKNGWQTDDPSFSPKNPYENRDPRLHYFIIVPGEKFGKIGSNDNYLCTWEGGRDVKDASATKRILTRYMVKKWQWEKCASGKNNNDYYKDYYYNTVHIRTTQVWLDYAEAMNEAYGPTAVPAGYTYSAVAAINKVRERAGQCDVRSEYTADKETFRQRIRNERGVELFMENHRWFDIRRWMIAQDLFAGDPYPIKGVKVTASNASATAPKANNVFSYQLMDVTETVRVFDKKHYWYPVGKDEAERMTKFKQNPGW